MPIQDVDLYELANNHYVGYSAKTNEDRMISSVADGLKPVQRRILWAIFENKARYDAKLIKAAKIVGHTLGNYHPHGDSSVYGAMQTMVSSMPEPLIHGGGNWGSVFGDPAAAYRYTECRLTKFSQEVFFDPFYMTAMKKVNNFNDDASIQEPVDLPARLPHYLVNGGMGIGVGIKGEFPSFTVPSLIATLKHYLANNEWDFSLLTLCSRYDAQPHEDKEAFDKLVYEGKAPITFSSRYTVNGRERTATIRDSFPDINLKTAMSRILEKENDVRSVDDISSPSDRFATIRIEMKRTIPLDSIEPRLNEICQKYFTGTSHFDMYSTLRTLPKDADEVSITLQTASVKSVLETWLTFRCTIERRACKHHYNKLKEANRRLSLLILASENIDYIIAGVKQDMTKQELNSYLQEGLNISQEDANFILDMKIHQLRKLERDDLQKQIESNQSTMADYKHRAQNPEQAILKDLDILEKSLNIKRS